MINSDYLQRLCCLIWTQCQGRKSRRIKGRCAPPKKKILMGSKRITNQNREESPKGKRDDVPHPKRRQTLQLSSRNLNGSQLNSEMNFSVNLFSNVFTAIQSQQVNLPIILKPLIHSCMDLDSRSRISFWWDDISPLLLSKQWTNSPILFSNMFASIQCQQVNLPIVWKPLLMH